MHSHSMHNFLLTDTEKQVYENEIRRLMQENSLLHSELQRRRGENPAGIDLHVQFLAKKLQEMGNKQRQMVAFLMEHMRNPRFPAPLVDQPDARDKRSSLLEFDQLELNEHSKGSELSTALVLNSDEKMEDSLDMWDDLQQGIGQKMAVDDDNADSSLIPPSAIVPMNIESPGDSERNIHAWSPRSAPSSSSRDLRSLSPELCMSNDQPESPTTSSAYLNIDISLNSSVIDVDSETCNNEVTEIEKTPSEQESEKTPKAPKETNDMFWEQFLTERPRQSETREVESTRSEGIYAVNEPASHGKFWWSPHYVTDFLKQITDRPLDERT
ncbi:hypothetical protein SAY86_010433 [Trapa natans]|uniref:Uncharacterized protein n=1 Tax=Trapa natans TaxID=22666 RepID=A0AAN7LJK2_TRANT|nr:hypothetical protein SAY86_010433 [Trapa natans]